MGMFLGLYLVVGLIAGVIAARTAPSMGRSAAEAFFLGLFLWPIALVMMAISKQPSAGSASLDAERIQEGLWGQASRDILFAQDPNTSPEALANLARMHDQNVSILLAIANNPNTPKETLSMFAMFKGPEVRAAAYEQLKKRFPRDSV